MAASGPEQKSKELKEPPPWVKVCWCYALDCEYCFAAHYCDHDTAECRWCKTDKDPPIQIEQDNKCVCDSKVESSTITVGDGESGAVRPRDKETTRASKKDSKSASEEGSSLEDVKGSKVDKGTGMSSQ